MSAELVPKLELGEATETSIHFTFTPVEGVFTYVLQWKLHPANWDQCSAKTIPVPISIASTSTTIQKKIVKADAEPLQPGMTYCVRLFEPNRGRAGPEVVADTEQVSCAPKGGGCCVVL